MSTKLNSASGEVIKYYQKNNKMNHKLHEGLKHIFLTILLLQDLG